MALDYRISAISALTLALASSPALAELSAAEVWADWKSYMADVGYVTSGEEVLNGGDVTIEGMTMTQTLPEGEGTITIDMGTTRFLGQADGSVRIDMQPKWQVGFDIAPETGEAVKGAVEIEQSGTSLVVSGDASNMTYDYTAQSMSMAMDEIVVDGEVMGADVFNLQANLSNTSSTTKMIIGDVRTYDQTVSVAGMTYAFNLVAPDDDGQISMQGAANGLNFDAKGDIPIGVDMNNFANVLRAGFAFGGGYTFSDGNLAMSFDGPDGKGTMNSASQGGTFNMSMSEGEGILYETEARGLEVNAFIEQMPIPISFGVEKAGFNFLFPLLQAEGKDFALGTTFEGLTISETLWALFDPTQQLPRDPATLTVNVTGKGDVLYDLADPEAATLAAADTPEPIQLQTLNVPQIVLDAVGARLTGEGAFKFNPDKAPIFDDVPNFDGVLDLQLVGGNGLIDKLVGMGLLPEQDAMGARMMLGLFARPGDGPDSLVSKIEVTEDGQVLANGQRIQ